MSSVYKYFNFYAKQIQSKINKNDPTSTMYIFYLKYILFFLKNYRTKHTIEKIIEITEPHIEKKSLWKKKTFWIFLFTTSILFYTNIQRFNN